MSDEERLRWIRGLVRRGIKRSKATEVVGARLGDGLRALEVLNFKEAYEAGYSMAEISKASLIELRQAFVLVHRSGAKVRRFAGGRRPNGTDRRARIDRCRDILFDGV